MSKFSERYGLQPSDPPITIRFEAPDELRSVIISIAYEAGLGPHEVRTIVCRLLRVTEDPTNWSAFPNVDMEVRGHLTDCAWYEVYDLAEVLYKELSRRRVRSSCDPSTRGVEHFQRNLNDYLRRRGIGWQLLDGQIQVRGEETFEQVLTSSQTALQAASLPTAASELREALRDLSRRPSPDVTGAVQHALAALECVARSAANDPKPTLGQILVRYPGLLPSPLNVAVEKLWGYASEQGRHLREGRVPTYPEAELAVYVCASVSSYLSAKIEDSGA
jgi:hypothetical protein